MTFQEPEEHFGEPVNLASPDPYGLLIRALRAPKTAVFPYWASLNVDGLASVRTATTGAAPNRHFVVEWRNVQLFDDYWVTFEVVFTEQGVVWFNYTDLGQYALGDSATIGLLDSTGKHGMQFSHFAPTLQAGSAVVYEPVGRHAPLVVPYREAKEQRDYIAAEDSVLPGAGGRVELPFPVNFFGQPQSHLWVTRLTDGETGTAAPMIQMEFSWAALMSPMSYSTIAPIVGPIIVDELSSIRTATIGEAPTRQFAIEWRNLGLEVAVGDIRRLSAEVVFSETGDIAYVYNGVDADIRRIVGAGLMGPPEWASSSLYYTPSVDGVYYSYIPSPDVGNAIVYAPPPNFKPSQPSYGVSTVERPYLSTTAELVLPENEYTLAHEGPFPIPLYGGNQPIGPEPFGQSMVIEKSGAVQIISPFNPMYLTLVQPYGRGNVVFDAESHIRTATTGTQPERVHIIEWRDVYHVDDGPASRFSFQVAFAEDGEIWFNYDGIDAGSNGEGFFVWTGIIALLGMFMPVARTYSFFEPVLVNDLAVVFTPTPVALPGAGAVPAGLMTRRMSAAGGVTTYAYHESGDLASTTDPSGLTRASEYDALGRLVASSSSSDVGEAPQDFGTTTYTYNERGQVLTVTEPGAVNPVSGVTHTAVTTYVYDGAGRPVSQALSDASGGDVTRTTGLDYDDAGRLISTTAPDGVVSGQEWDAAGDLWRETLPGGLVLEHDYDASHRLVSTTAVGEGVDPMDPTRSSMVVESRSYDPAGRLATVVDAMGRTTRYGYYGDGLLATVTGERSDPLPDVVTEEYVYDAAGHPVTITTAGGRVRQLTYDPAGNLHTQALDPGGLNRVTTHAYNPDGSVAFTTATGAASPAGRVERVDYTYDASGRLLSTTVDNSGGGAAALTTTMVRDSRGLVTRETDPSGVAVEYTYDVAGRVRSTTGAPRTVWVAGASTPNVSPTVLVGRNTFGDQTHLRDPDGRVVLGAFDAMGRPTTVTLPSYTPPGGSPVSSAVIDHVQRAGPAGDPDRSARPRHHDTYDKYGRGSRRDPTRPRRRRSEDRPGDDLAYYRDGELLKTVDPAGAATSATYDELGRQITQTESERVGAVHVLLHDQLRLQRRRRSDQRRPRRSATPPPCGTTPPASRPR